MVRSDAQCDRDVKEFTDLINSDSDSNVSLKKLKRLFNSSPALFFYLAH